MGAGTKYDKTLNMDSQSVKTPAVLDTTLDEWMMLIRNYVYTGTLWVPQKGEATGEILAKLIESNASIGEIIAAGKAAHDAAASGNPVQIGGVYRSTDPALSNGDVGSLRVNAKGEALVEVTGSNTQDTASDTITIGTGAAHSAGDVVSTDAGEILQFDTGLTAGASGVIYSSLVTLGQNAVFSGGAGYYLYLFNASPTAQATNAAFDLADADVAGYLGRITIDTLVDLGSNCASNNTEHNFNFKLAAADTKLYGKLVCIGAETTVTGKVITIKLGIGAL